MTNPLSVSSRTLLSLAMFLESFCGYFGTSSSMEGPSLVNLAILVEERTRDTDTRDCSSYYFTRFARHVVDQASQANSWKK